MNGSCTGRCIHFKDYRKNGGKYADGFCRCIQCEAVFRHDGVWCSCCSNRVRRRTRYKKK